MPNETPTRDLSNESSEPRAERERSRVRFWTWAAILALPLFMLCAYWFHLRTFSGAYLFDPRLPYQSIGFNVVADPLPRVRGLSTPRGEFFLAKNARRLLVFDGSRRGWTALDIDDAPGEPSRFRRVKFSVGGIELVAEVYPVGSLDEIEAAVGDWPRFAASAEALASKFPDRLTPKYWAVAGRAAAGDQSGAQVLLDRWRGDFSAPGEWRGARYLKLLESDMAAAEPGEDARRLGYAKVFGRGAGFVRGSRRSGGAGAPLGDLLAWTADQRGQPPRKSFSLFASQLPDFLSAQVAAKLARAYSVFLAASGQRGEALDLAFGSIVVGRGVGVAGDGGLIGFLIAAATDAIGTQGLEILLVRTSWSAEELAALWPEVDALLGDANRIEFDDMVALDSLLPPGSVSSTSPPKAGPNWAEAWTRRLVADAQQDLLREGTRALHVQASTGNWPEIGPAQTALGLSLEPAVPIVDPFEPARGLRAERTADGFRLWSVGPDRKDDGGTTIYDPTNGTFSAGDVALELDQKPRYDFPRDAGHVYANAAEWNERYPMGLPADPFSNGGQEPLRLSADGTNRLWSFGPDADQGPSAWPDPTKHLITRYDPTNGLASAGDLWVEIPFAEGAK